MLLSQQGQVYAGVLWPRRNAHRQPWQQRIEVNTGLTDFQVASLVALGNTLYTLTPSGIFTSGGESWTRINNPITGASNLESYQQFVLERASESEEEKPEQLLTGRHEENAIEADSTPLVSLTSLGGTLYGGTAGGSCGVTLLEAGLMWV